MKKFNFPQFFFFVTFIIASGAWIFALIRGHDLWLWLAFVMIGMIGMKTFE